MFFPSRRPFGPRAAGQKGFSLIELLLVLGVIALLLVAAFVVYPKVRLANQANTEVKNLTTVQAGLKALYASKNNNFSGLTLDLARDAKIFPSTMVVGNTVVNSWGGDVVLGPAANPYSGFAGGRSYVIRYRKVPADACVALISRAAGYFLAIGVGTESKADGSYNKIVHVVTDPYSTGYNSGTNSGLQVQSMTNECNSREESEIMFIGS